MGEPLHPGNGETTIGDRKVTLDVTTNYPWDGSVTLKPKIEQSARFELRLRVPGWCQGATVSVNGDSVAHPTVERGYIVLGREWKSGDAVVLNLPMPVERVAANPRVKDDLGLLAIQRGPLVYCLEACDQGEPLEALACLNMPNSKQRSEATCSGAWSW